MKKKIGFFTYQAEIGSRSNEKGSSSIGIHVNSCTNESRAYENNEHCTNSKTNHSHHQVNPSRNHCEKLKLSLIDKRNPPKFEDTRIETLAKED